MSLKARRARADTHQVSDGHPLPTAVDQVLASLPDEVMVAGDGEARLVVGPVGAFVLLPTPARGPAVGDAARRLHDLARRTRSQLGQHVAWVPFLDALLVSASRLMRRADVTVAPVDLLAVVLTEGPTMIDASTLAALRRAVADERLGRWRTPAADDDPVPGNPVRDGPVAGGEGCREDPAGGRGRIGPCPNADASPTTCAR